MGWLVCGALKDEMGELPVAAAAGLSLGEFTAHTAAGTFDFDTGSATGGAAGGVHAGGLREHERGDGGDDRRG